MSRWPLSINAFAKSQTSDPLLIGLPPVGDLRECIPGSWPLHDCWKLWHAKVDSGLRRADRGATMCDGLDRDQRGLNDLLGASYALTRSVLRELVVSSLQWLFA